MKSSLIMLASGLLIALAHADEIPTHLKCAGWINPLGLDDRNPTLSWQLETTGESERGQVQTAYQVLASSSLDLLQRDRGDLWDSGKVASDEPLNLPYAGVSLASAQHVFWKVRVWDRAGRASAWSPPATWTMGLLKPSDWQAKWITASKWYMPPDLRPKGLIVNGQGWADVDLGRSVPIDEIRLFFEDTNAVPRKFRIEGSDEPQFYRPQILVDQTAGNYSVSVVGPQVFTMKRIKARHIRLQITQASANGKAVVRQMEVISAGRNVALMRPTRECGTDWYCGHAVFLVDGMPSMSDGNQCPVDACPTPTAPLFRKTFGLQKSIKQATLYVAALGMADVSINGQPVTDAVLGPPLTDYTKHVVYLTRDCTACLTNGENVIGVTLGNGFFSVPRRGFGERQNGYGPPRILIQLGVQFADGTRRTIISDESWKWARSEIIYNDTFDSYSEDRRLAKPGWDQAGYDDSGWLAAAPAPSLGGKLVAPMGPPIRLLGELQPQRVEGNHAYFKVLSAGWPQLKINGRAGQTITLLGHAPNYNAPKLTFTLATNGPAVLCPRFMYLSGPLDLEVEGLTEPLAADAVKIELVRADLNMTGNFSCSNPYLNQIYEALLRTHLNYDGDQPMDPMREKQGWTQDMQGMFETAAYLTDVSGIYRKWWHDFADGQDASGYLGSVLPMVGRQVNDWNSPWWSGVAVLLPWEHYQYYGDRHFLAAAYDTMRRYVDFLGDLAASGSVRGWDAYPYLSEGNPNSAEARERILSWKGAGDWQNPFGGKDAVPAPLLDMPAWSYYASIVSQTAALLGKTADAAKYAALARDVKDRFNAKYLNLQTGLYGSDPASQTAQVLPLALNLVPQPQRQLTYQGLLTAIHDRQDHLGTGFVGLPFLLRTLTDARESTLANRLVNQQDFPGWKTLMHHGVLGEDWHGGGAQMPSCGGAIGQWLYQSVLGIRPDPDGPGFKKFILAPQPDPATGLTSARGSYDSVRGKIVSEWRIEAKTFYLNATIPANTSATVYLPTVKEESVCESGIPASQVKGIKFLGKEKGAAVYEVEAGNYAFTADLTGWVGQ